MTNLCVCRYTSNQAKRISYFRLKNDVGPKNMRQTSLLVASNDFLVLRHHHISASLDSFFCTRPVRDSAAILATLELNHEKIRSNEKKLPLFLGRSKYLKLTKSAEGL